MNNITLLGRFTRDPEVRYTQTGKVVCTGTIAVDRPFSKNGQHETDFIPIVIWGKQAEICGNNFSKGKRILVEGRLQTRKYEAKDGTKRTAFEVIVNHLYFIEKKVTADAETLADMQSLGTPVPIDEEINF